MGLLERVTGAARAGWSAFNAKAAKPRDEEPVDDAGKKKPAAQTGSGAGFVVGKAVIQALSRDQPGSWSSDHRAEAEHVKGWNYIAIDALGIQAMQCDIDVYKDGTDEKAAEKKAIRKSFRALLARGSITKSVYQQSNTANPPLPETHPLVKILKKPNPSESGSCFRYEQVMQARGTGNVYILNIPNKAGNRTVHRYVVPTAMIQPIDPDMRPGMENGGYRIVDLGGRYRWGMDAQGFRDMRGFAKFLNTDIPASMFQVIRLPHPLWKDDGYSPLAAGAMMTEALERTDVARVASLDNSARPSLLVMADPQSNPSPEQLTQAEDILNDKLAGVEKTGKVLCTAAGSVETLSTTPREMEFGATYPQVRDGVLALHGTPAIAAGMMGERGSYAALYATLTGWSLLRVQPLLDFLAEEDTRYFAKEYGDGYTIEYSAMAINDPDVLEKQLQTEISGGGIRKVDEVRSLRGLEPLGGEEGERIFGAAVAPMAKVDADGNPIEGPEAQTEMALLQHDLSEEAADSAHERNKESVEHEAGFAGKPTVGKKPGKKGPRAKRLGALLSPGALAALQGAASEWETKDEAREVLKTLLYP